MEVHVLAMVFPLRRACATWTRASVFLLKIDRWIGTLRKKISFAAVRKTDSSFSLWRREGRVWCADLLMDVDMWWGSCEVCVVQVGVLCPERSRFTHSGENVSGLAGEAIMLCMEPLCVRMMQLAFFTLSFT
jgi:hypothetical protein